MELRVLGLGSWVLGRGYGARFGWHLQKHHTHIARRYWTC